MSKENDSNRTTLFICVGVLVLFVALCIALIISISADVGSDDVVDTEVVADAPTNKSKQTIQYDALKIGNTYQASKEITVSPYHSPEGDFNETMDRVSAIKRIPGPSHFTVIDKILKNGKPWYKIRLQQGKIGWINSSVLLGQEVTKNF